MPKKCKYYRWRTKRMGGIETGIVRATTKAIALKKVHKRNRMYRGIRITLKKLR